MKIFILEESKFRSKRFRKQFKDDHIIFETDDPEEVRKIFQEFLITNAYCRVFKVEDIPDVNEMEVSANKN